MTDRETEKWTNLLNEGQFNGFLDQVVLQNTQWEKSLCNARWIGVYIVIDLRSLFMNEAVNI